MRSDGEQGPDRLPVRAYPYYRIQCYDDRVAAWRDIQHSFRTLEELCHFAQVNLEPTQRMRVIMVEGYRSRRILPDVDVFDTSLRQSD